MPGYRTTAHDEFFEREEDEMEQNQEDEFVDPCPVCADGPVECSSCYGDGVNGGGYECTRCGGSGQAIPDHCCDCRTVGPYCMRCHKCGAECAGNCRCPITVTRADGTVATL